MPWPPHSPLTDAVSSLSPAERSSLVLDGEAISLGHTVITLGTVADQSARLACVAPTFSDDIVVLGLCAAWVWGALPDTPDTVDIADVEGNRIGVAVPAHVNVRDINLTADDVIQLGHNRVTTVERTMLDIARYETALTAGAVCEVLAQLEKTLPGSLEVVAQRLRTSTHLPYKRLALSRVICAQNTGRQTEN